MSTLPRRQYGVFVTIGLALVGAVVAGFVLLTSGKASDVDLTTASFVPKDAALYVAVNTDLSSSQWVAAFKLAQRLGEEDPEQELRDTAEDEDIDWEEEVAPFLGGNAAFFLRGFDFESVQFDGAIIIQCDDVDKAVRVVLDRAKDIEFEQDTYRGHAFYASSEGDVFFAAVDGHLIVTSSEDSLFEVMDVHDGRQPALDTSDDFRNLRDELTKNFLAFAYLNAEEFATGILTDDVVREALKQAGTDSLAFKPVALVIAARGDTFQFHTAAVGDAGSISPMLQPRESRFVKLVPADSSVFVSTFGLAQTWNESVDKAREQIDDALAEEGTYGSLDEALESLGSEAGLSSLQELIDLFSGETAVAAWFPGGDTDSAEVVGLAEVEDEAAARDVMERVFLSEAGDEVTRSTVNGIELVVGVDEDGEAAAYAITDGYVVFGTVEGVRAIIDPQITLLSGLKGYRDTVDQLDTALGTYAYLDLATLVGLDEGGVPPQLDEATRALGTLIINLVEERNVVRLTGAVSVK